MRVLLDTHVLLWWLAADPLLPGRAETAIADADNDVIVSAATAWELAIKKAAGLVEAPDDLSETLAANDFQTLSIDVSHAVAAGALPAHHSDPFDRMLIAQARVEGLTFVTVDRRFSDYDVEQIGRAHV